jgi:hypothetical protein
MIRLVEGRRTHSVHRTADEARDACHDLAMLMNGVPTGYVFAIGQRLGAWVFFSAPVEAFAKAAE